MLSLLHGRKRKPPLSSNALGPHCKRLREDEDDNEGYDSKTARLIHHGHQLMREGNIDSAFKQFNLIENLCPCEPSRRQQCQRSHVQPPRLCGCNAIFTLLCKPLQMSSSTGSPSRTPQSGSLWLDLRGFSAYLRQRCSCTTGWNPCNHKSHLMALDGMAAAYFTRMDFEKSKAVACTMVMLQPSSPEGYLRLAKLHMRFTTEATRWVRAIYRHGAINIDHSRDPESTVLKIFNRGLRHNHRFDILRHSPREIQVMILQDLSLQDRMSCLRVSKSWRRGTHSHQIIWRNLTLEKFMKPAPKALQQLWTSSGQRLDTICIKDCANYGLDLQKLTDFINMSKETTHFELRAPIKERIRHIAPGLLDTRWLPDHPRSFIRSNVLAKCQTLILDHIVEDDNGKVLNVLLESSAKYLHTLSVHGLPRTQVPLSQPKLNLTIVKLIAMQGCITDLSWLLATAPNIKQLYLDDITVGTRNSTSLPQGFDIRAGFPRLEVLVLGDKFRVAHTSPNHPRQMPLLPASLKVLDILTTSPLVVSIVLRQFGIFCGSALAPLPDPEPPVLLTALECLRIRADTEPSATLGLISQASNLKVLELGSSLYEPPLPLHMHPVEYITPESLPSSVTAVGMHEFRWNNALSYHAPYSGYPVVEWVSKFPTVPETVACYPQHFDTAGETVQELVRIPGVKTIYQNCLKGSLRDKVLQEAAEKGVVIHHTAKPFRPPTFPWPSEE